MTENMKKFLMEISKDEALTAKVGAMGREELIALAKELGIALTDADLEKPAVQELGDDELEPVAGGDVSCACVLAGAGYSTNGRERCVCGFAGYGYDT